jgi:hypothetical protein
MNRARRILLGISSFLIVTTAYAQQPTQTVERDGVAQKTQQQWSHVGLLRARDLTPFGLLRLDMLPAHTADAKAGSWTFEAQYAYQNTFVMSDNVEAYLESRNVGRAPLSPRDAATILAFPDDAYYFDGEIGLADLVLQRRLNESWSAYLTVPYIRFGRGVFDGTIESFHDTFGFGQMGRDLVARDQFQVIYRVNDVRLAQLTRKTDDGFGDPVIGLRYSFPEPRFGWDLVAEVAAKVALDGERFLLSTGKNDYGMQLTLQRRFGPTGRHAAYLSVAGVYYAGGGPARDESDVIPTLIAGYSYGLTRTFSVILQGYASQSVVHDSTLGELTDDKYQFSVGLQRRTERFLFNLAFTENVSNLENTPDIGVQVGFAYMPRAQ